MKNTLALIGKNEWKFFVNRNLELKRLTTTGLGSNLHSIQKGDNKSKLIKASFDTNNTILLHTQYNLPIKKHK
jgi:hypothetical protein